MNKGSLVIVGTGIKTAGQLTVESIAWMKVADKLLYLVADPVAEESIHQLNPGRTESLYRFYDEGKQRLDTYNEMVDRILACVRGGMKTCVAFYGHPGVFVYPSHEAIRQARKDGYSAKMLPGISAEDCLFADLGVDPSTFGCQSYEATDFMVSNRIVDPSSSVILWQIGVVGDWTYKRNGFDLSALPLLMERLYRYYPRNHRVYIYEAAMYIDCPPVIKRLPLQKIRDLELTASSTLYIPPSEVRPVDYAMWGRLNNLAMNAPSGRRTSKRPRKLGVKS